MRKKTEETVRVNFIVPASLLSEIEKIAEERQTTVSDVFRRATKLTLSAEKARKKGGGVYLQEDANSKPKKIQIFGL